MAIWLHKQHTNPDIADAIIAHLHSWRNPSTAAAPTRIVLEDLLQKQDKIGWESFFEGWMSVD
jgi:hypothetical protein